MRLMTMPLPSIASRPPANDATSSDFVSRCATSMMRPTSRIPKIATERRQPVGFDGPSRTIPRPMSHFPSGGWTAKEP